MQVVSNVVSWITDMRNKANEGIKNIIDSIVNWFKELPRKNNGSRKKHCSRFMGWN